MNPQPPYQHYEEALAKEDFFSAIELLKECVTQKTNAVTEWYWLGYALTRVHLHAEAEFYLRRALSALDTATPTAMQTAETYITKASVYALLKEKDICLQHICTALWLKPSLLNSLPQDAVLQNALDKQDWKHIEAIHNTRYFAEQSTKQKWEKTTGLLDKSTDSKVVYTRNAYWTLSLTYNAMENGISLLLQSRQDETDVYLYHMRSEVQNFQWLDTLFAYQDIITNTHWSDLSEALIEVCESVVWEMSDGRRIKIG